MDTNYKSSRTSEWQLDQPHPYTREPRGKNKKFEVFLVRAIDSGTKTAHALQKKQSTHKPHLRPEIINQRVAMDTCALLSIVHLYLHLVGPPPHVDGVPAVIVQTVANEHTLKTKT